MAELQFPNIARDFLQGQAIGRERAAQDRAQANQTRLGELAQMAYGAAPEARGQYIGQAVGINPEAGLALDRGLSQQDDAREQRLLSTARLIAAAPEEQKGAIFAQVRPQIAEYLPGLPETYTPQVGQGINAFIQSRSGAGGGAKVIGNALVDQNGNEIYRAPQTFTTDTGLIEYVPGQGAREIRLGASQPASPSAGAMGPLVTNPDGIQGRYSIGQDGMPVFIQADTSPQDQAAIMRSEGQFATQDSVALPPQDQGQRILPSGAAARQRQLELSEQSAARQEAAAARAADAAERAATAGERTANTETFRNEQALRKEVSDLVKDNRTILSAYDKVKTTAKNASAANDLALIFSYMKMLDPGSVVREGEFATAQNAAGVPDQVLNIYNRARNGERLNTAQRQQFISSAGDIAAQAQASIDRTAEQYRGIAQGSGLDPDRATGLKAPKPKQEAAPQAAPVQRAKNPKTGQIIELRNGQWVPVNG